jgi:uncharacterized protein YhfF
MSTDIKRWQGIAAFAFGDSSRMADELGAKVIAGTKTATCWAAVQGRLTEVGEQMVMLDGQGRGWAVIEATELTERAFDDIDEAFAREEGEGDLEEWRDIHRRYFTREGTFAPDMNLYCERFRVVRVLDREPAQ